MGDVNPLVRLIQSPVTPSNEKLPQNLGSNLEMIRIQSNTNLQRNLTYDWCRQVFTVSLLLFLISVGIFAVLIRYKKMEIIKFEGVYSSVHWSAMLFSDINCKGEMWHLEWLLRWHIHWQWIYSVRNKAWGWLQHLHIDIPFTML